MKTNRRRFLGTAAAAGGALAILPSGSCSGETRTEKTGRNYADYSRLDEALGKPVFRRELFPDPVIIESLELLMDRNSILYRVRSTDGAEGIAAGHPFIAPSSYPMVPRNLVRHFEGLDARDLDQMIFNAVESNVKSQGVPLNVHVAGIEFAIDQCRKLLEAPNKFVINENLGHGSHSSLVHDLFLHHGIILYVDLLVRNSFIFEQVLCASAEWAVIG